MTRTRWGLWALLAALLGFVLWLRISGRLDK